MYIYNDEDNAPMVDDPFDLHNPTVYSCRAEMKAVEAGISEKEKPADGCWNCLNFDWNREACTAGWNNMDESYYNPDADDRKLTDYCEYHDLDPDADPADIDFGGNEP